MPPSQLLKGEHIAAPFTDTTTKRGFALRARERFGGEKHEPKLPC